MSEEENVSEPVNVSDSVTKPVEKKTKRQGNLPLIGLTAVVLILAVSVAVVGVTVNEKITGLELMVKELKDNAGTGGNVQVKPSEPVQAPPEFNLEELMDDDPVKGNSNAPITIVEFSEFQCPYCGAAYGSNAALIAKFQESDPSWEAPYGKVMQEYVDTGKVRYVFRDFPLSFHENAQKASEASQCAFEQDKFWEYHDLLFENQEALTVPDLKSYAEQLGLNTTQFNDCLDSGEYAQEVQDDLAYGQSIGVSGTPTFFINDKVIVGARGFADFKQLIEAELALLEE
ncbi:MAG: DsbA family protein [archaeon]